MTQASVMRKQATPPVPVNARGAKEIEAWLVEELHDGVAQSLWYLGVELSALCNDISPELTGLREQVEKLGHVAQESCEQLRALLGTARGLEQCGRILGEVVQEEVQTFEERTEVQVRLIIRKDGDRIPHWKAHHVSAILREALWNAWRHGKGQKVQVELDIREGAVVLIVADKGPGFVLSGPAAGHFGLATMGKRAQALGGQLQVISRPGVGARIVLTFPASG